MRKQNPENNELPIRTYVENGNMSAPSSGFSESTTERLWKTDDRSYFAGLPQGARLVVSQRAANLAGLLEKQPGAHLAVI